MKKILFLLLCTVSIYGQTMTSDFKTSHIIFGNVEIEGHFSKSYFIFEATLEGIKIYDRDTKQKYKLRKCDVDKCKTIHLEVENDFILSSGIIIQHLQIN